MCASLPRKRRTGPQASRYEATEDSKRVRSLRFCLMDTLVTRRFFVARREGSGTLQKYPDTSCFLSRLLPPLLYIW
jgi:hypothetical protein